MVLRLGLGGLWYATLFGMCPEPQREALRPWGGIAGLGLLWVASHASAWVAQRVPVGVPPLLGMVLTGVCLRNFSGCVNHIPAEWSAIVRHVGLSVILLRAGLQLDVQKLRALSRPACLLACMPCTLEALAVAGIASWIFDMPVALALCLGFVLAAISPAVVVTGMLDLESKGYGIRKGIPSIMVAAASIDDILCITGFTMSFGVAVRLANGTKEEESGRGGGNGTA